jgi:hypothetical protein
LKDQRKLPTLRLPKRYYPDEVFGMHTGRFVGNAGASTRERAHFAELGASLDMAHVKRTARRTPSAAAGGR